MITERHELLEQYLADLDRRLAGAEPGERADIAASVREHVEADLAELGRPATSQDVAASLAALGSVDAVAAAWSPDGLAPAASAGPAPTAPTAPTTAIATTAPAARKASGLVVAAGVLAVLALLSLALPPLAGALGAGALALGIVALRRGEEPRWVPITSIVVGAVAVVVGLLVVLAAALLFTVRSDGPAVQEPVVSEMPAQPTDG